MDRTPDETTILNFRRLLEKHELAGGILQVINGYLVDRSLMLRHGTVVAATIIHAPSSTKNKGGKRDPEMHQTKRGTPVMREKRLEKASLKGETISQEQARSDF